MKCEYCEFARECTDPAQNGGGCDIDGVDDFGCDSGHDDEEERPYCNGGDCERHMLGAEPCAHCPFCDEEGNI